NLLINFGKVFAYYFKTESFMKIFFAAAVALLVSTSAAFAQTELPNTVIKDLNTGKKIAFNETVEKGKVTLITFWATWCIPCKAEIQNIRDKMPQWKEEADFDFITVSMDGARNEGIARTYTRTKRWDFPTY